jgi:hypothetical protein
MPSSPTRDKNPRCRRAGATASESRSIASARTDQQRQGPHINANLLESSKFWEKIGEGSVQTIARGAVKQQETRRDGFAEFEPALSSVANGGRALFAREYFMRRRAVSH